MRTIVITGASDGIGAATSRILRRRADAALEGAAQARLIVVGRSPEKTQRVADEVGGEPLTADFAHLDEVRALADSLLGMTEQIDVLANNAGGIFSGPELTDDGFERTFQVDVLAPILLTNLLLPTLLHSRATVVNTASIAARLFGRLDLDDLQTLRNFTPNRAYGTAKLGNILFTLGLHRAFCAQGLSAVAFHPGVVATGFASGTDGAMGMLYRSVLGRHLFSSSERGGERLARFILEAPGTGWRPGAYYEGRRAVTPPPAARDPKLVERYWERVSGLLGLDW
jgi:NAD(P)-dependent dehydrogenase (short-subunit alcohol dehydrogenase family)